MPVLLLPTDPAERRLAQRFAWILGSLAAVLLMVVLATAGTWPYAMTNAEAAGKKVKLEHLVQVWVWRGLAVDIVLAALLAVSVRWWVGRVHGLAQSVPVSRRFWIIAVLLLVVAVSFRAPRLGLSFYNDEAHNFVRMMAGEWKHESPTSDAITWRGATWVETLWYNKAANNSQPHSLLSRLSYQAWKAVTGGADGEVSEWAARLPTLLAGLASLLVLGLALREIAGDVVGSVTLFAGALHAWHCRYSTEARGYGIMVLGIALMILFLHRARKHGRWRDWLGYGFANFLCLWAFLGSFYWVAALNGALMTGLLWQWGTKREKIEPLVRLFVVGVLAIMLALALMLPLFSQLLQAMKDLSSLRGTMGVAWWQDIGSHLLFGCRWGNADPTHAQTAALTRYLAEDPKWWLAVANAIVITGVGWCAMISRGGVGRLVAIAGVLAIVLGWADMARKGLFLHHWYVFYSVPVVLCAVGYGVQALLSQVRLQGWQRWFGALLLAVVATRMTTAVAVDYQSRSKGDERGPVEYVRGTVYPHFLKDKEATQPLVGALWTNAPIYDPLMVVLRDATVFEQLKQRATVEQRPLYVILSHRDSARIDHPTIIKELDGPGYERMAVFPGLDDKQYSQELFRRK